MALTKEYKTDKIRNVAVLGHGGAGKTSLIDALCYSAGSSRRKGNVTEGNALTMYTPEEASHGISLQCTPAFCEFSGAKINLLDTPGFMDFVGDTLAAIRVADSAVIVVSATLRRGGRHGNRLGVCGGPGNPPVLFCIHDG